MCRRGALEVALATLLLLVGLAASSAAELGDPTRPARGAASSSARAASEDLTLRAVVIRGTQRFAVIGDRRVSVGDRIAGGKVVAIELASVRLFRGGHEIVLQLGGSADFKQPASGSRMGGGSK